MVDYDLMHKSLGHPSKDVTVCHMYRTNLMVFLRVLQFPPIPQYALDVHKAKCLLLHICPLKPELVCPLSIQYIL